jgi:outer membrane protein OmpA-like peptidoglycan-associated protein
VIDDPVAVRKDEYGRISFREEKKGLLRFAGRLRKNPGATADVTYYAEERAQAGETRWRAKRVSQYLVKSGVRPSRINVINGGRSRALTLQLFIVLSKPEVP